MEGRWREQRKEGEREEEGIKRDMTAGILPAWRRHISGLSLGGRRRRPTAAERLHLENSQENSGWISEKLENMFTERICGPLTLQSPLAVLQLQHSIVDQPPPQQILSGKDLATLRHHDGLAVHAAVEVLQAVSLLVLVHLAIDRGNHLLHQPDSVRQVLVVFLAFCVRHATRERERSDRRLEQMSPVRFDLTPDNQWGSNQSPLLIRFIVSMRGVTI